MKLTKILLSTLSVAALAFTVSSCDQAASGNTTATNAVNKSNVATVVNTNQTANNNVATVANKNAANAAKPAANAAKNSTAAKKTDSESENVSGELQTGKTESVILYVGMETGDYAAYCFKNDSEAGRAILAVCKNGDQCEVKATFGDTEAECKVPGLEATLSASFNLVKVASARSLGRRK